MADLPPIKRLDPDDYKEVEGNWLRRMISVMNQYFEATYRTLNKGVTLEDNIVSKVYEYTFTTKSDYTSGNFETIKFNNGIGKRARIVLLGQIVTVAGSYIPITSAVTIDWLDLNGTININHITGLANTTKYKATFLVF